MRFLKTMMATILLVLLFNVMVSAQESERDKRRITQPTVSGATGLFTVYDSSTLKRGEFNVGFFANNYDRDPGDVDIMQYPVNVAFGVTDRVEVFLQTDGYQRVISNAPFELSGPLFPGLSRQQGSFGLDGVNINFPELSQTNPQFFPLNGAPISGAVVGGILPGLPQTGSRPIFDPVLRANKPGFFVPGFLNDFPFLGKGGGTLGSASFGTKISFRPERGIGFAILGIVKVPTVPAGALLQKDRGGRLTQGSGAGATDFGVFLITSLRRGLVSTHLNFGYVHANDPKSRNFELLDRSDSLIFSAGVDVPINRYVQLIGEATYNYYVGEATPTLNRPNPVDVLAGARFYPFGKDENRRFLFSFGGGYRYFANNSGSEREEDTINRVIATGTVPAATIARSLEGDYNGFVAHITLGLRNTKAAPPPPPAADPCANAVAPTIELAADKLAVKERSNDVVKFSTRGMGDGLTYNWTATGGSFTDNGSAERTWSSANLAPGTYTITVTVTDKCNLSKSDTRTITVEKGNRCPTVSIKANPTTAQEGADVTFNFTAGGNDPDGDKLQYVWTTTRGTLNGGDAAKQLNSTGLSAGNITVKVTVSDGQCSATDSVTVSITPRPAPPTVFTTSCNTYKTVNDSRPDNACKRVLDDVAARLQNDRNAVLIIDGHSDNGEKAGTAKTRAQRVRDYLVNERNLDAGRIEVRSFDNQRPDPSGDRALNRRVMLHVVPQGATRPE